MGSSSPLGLGTASSRSAKIISMWQGLLMYAVKIERTMNSYSLLPVGWPESYRQQSEIPKFLFFHENRAWNFYSNFGDNLNEKPSSVPRYPSLGDLSTIKAAFSIRKIIITQVTTL